jgi:hypothetical protein
VTAAQSPATSPATVAADKTSPVATSPAPTPAPADGQGTLKTYTNAEYGFTIRIPESWTASGESSSLAGVTKYKVVFDDPSFTSSQYITVTPGANGLPLEDWARIFSSQVTADPSRRVVSQEAIQVDGAPAKKFVLVAGSGSNAFQSMVVMTVKGDKSYFMEFTSRENDYSWYSKDADEILGTFRFT